jgi:hypothetical protein
MGSALSPEAVNFFMGIVESFCGKFGVPDINSIAKQSCASTCYLKKRYIDDYSFIFGGASYPQITALMKKFTQIIKARSGLNLEVTISEDGMYFLDIHVYKPADFMQTGKFACKTHQKASNKYQYLHRHSLHPPHTFRALIRGELTRHCVTCSSQTDYNNMKYKFAMRLLRRGYSAKETISEFNSLEYDTVRQSFQCDKPSHGINIGEMDSDIQICPKFLKLQFNSTTQNLKAKPVVQTAVEKIRTSLNTYASSSNDKRVLDHLARVAIEVCHKKAKTMGSAFMSS